MMPGETIPLSMYKQVDNHTMDIERKERLEHISNISHTDSREASKLEHKLTDEVHAIFESAVANVADYRARLTNSTRKYNALDAVYQEYTSRRTSVNQGIANAKYLVQNVTSSLRAAETAAEKQVTELNATARAMQLERSTKSLERYRQSRLRYRKISQSKFLLTQRLASASAALSEWKLLGERAKAPLEPEGVSQAHDTIRALSQALQEAEKLKSLWGREMPTYNKLAKDVRSWNDLNEKARVEALKSA